MKNTMCSLILVTGLFISQLAFSQENNKTLSLDMKSLMSHLLTTHEEIKSYQDKVNGARFQLRQALGDYYPALDFFGDAGWEKIEKEYSQDTDESRHNITLKATQLITDFGKTTGTIDRSRVLLDQSKIRLESVKQRIMLEGLTAYINIVRARERLESAQYSEKRIKELTGIEKALVDKGAGLSTDVLQAKSQLSGAMAISVEVQGELKLAKNRFQAVFSHIPTPDEVDVLQSLPFPAGNLPATQQEAVEIALKNNPELQTTQFDLDLADKDISLVKSAFFPRLGLFASTTNADDDDGLDGYKRDYAVGLEFNYNLASGGSDMAALKSARAFKISAVNHYSYAKRLVKEQVRNSWENLTTLQQRESLLNQQADILLNFLELAKKERKMGTRSLLDVLNGEVNYINALGTAIAAKEDTKIAAYTLLFTMGAISEQLFQ